MLTASVDRLGTISRLVFGCAAVGGRVSAAASLRAMSAAHERGVTTFDTARSYGYGDAESILGKFLSGRRHTAQVVTKAGIAAPRSSPILRVAKAAARSVFARIPSARQLVRPALGKQHSGGHFSAAELEQSLTTSLRSLQTDYVDAFMLHACTQEVVADENVLRTLQGFVRRGMARRIGVASGISEAKLWLECDGDPTIEIAAAQLPQLPEVPSSVLLLANQPFDGGKLIQPARAACRDLGVDEALALETLLLRPLDLGASAVVASLLSSNHVDVATRCFTSPQTSRSQREEIFAAIRESV